MFIYIAGIDDDNNCLTSLREKGTGIYKIGKCAITYTWIMVHLLYVWYVE